MILARLLAAASAVLLAACAAENTPAACRVVPLAEVPLHMLGNRAAIDVAIEGKPARLLLDTGASGLLMTEAAFDRLGLRYDLRLTGSSTSVDAHALTRVSEPVATELGSVKLKPTPLAVVQSATDLTPQTGLDGLLGTTPLAEYDLDIDLPHQRFVLNEPRRCPAGTPPFEGPSVTLRAPPNPRHALQIPVRIDDHDRLLLVDTGASRTYLNEARIGLTSTELNAGRSVSVRSAGAGAVSARLHRFAEFQLGQEVRRNPTFLVGPLRTDADGLLGADYMRTHRVWLSFAGWAVTVQQP
jgi:hypothetical protein